MRDLPLINEVWTSILPEQDEGSAFTKDVLIVKITVKEMLTNKITKMPGKWIVNIAKTIIFKLMLTT